MQLVITPKTRIIKVKLIKHLFSPSESYKVYTAHPSQVFHAGFGQLGMLEALGAILLEAKQFCTSCKKITHHTYLEITDNCHCLMCNEPLDKRQPEQEVIEIDFKNKTRK